MATVIEKMTIKLSAPTEEAIKHLEEANRHLDETRDKMKISAEETESWWKKNRMTMAAIAAATAGMMYAIMRASPSMSITMAEIRWQFQYMAYIVGEATAPVLRAFIPLLRAMAEAFAGLPEGIQMVIGVIIMVTMVVNTMTAAMGPWGLAILAIILAVVLLKTAWEENWGDIQGKTEAVWEVIEPIFNALKTIFEAYVEYLNAVYDVLEKVWGALETLADKLEPIRGFLDAIWTGIENFIGILEDVLGPLQDAIDLLDKFIDKLKDAGSYLPFSLALKGPFSKEVGFDKAIAPSLERAKKMIHEHFVSPISGVSMIGGRGATTATSSTVHLHQTINVQGYGGSAFELRAVMERSTESMMERIRRRIG